MYKRSEIKRVSKEEAAKIIEMRKPIGVFICVDGDKFIGIDNETGDAWTEEFDTETKCRRWLRPYVAEKTE